MADEQVNENAEKPANPAMQLGELINDNFNALRERIERLEKAVFKDNADS